MAAATTARPSPSPCAPISPPTARATARRRARISRDGAQQALAEFATKAGAGASCAEILSQPGQQGSDILEPLIEGIDSEDVTVDGDTAELTIEGAQVPATLEQVNGEWLVTEGYVRESFQLGGS